MPEASKQSMAAQMAALHYGRRQVQRATRLSAKKHQRSLSSPNMKWLHPASTDGQKARRAASVPNCVVCTELSSTESQPPVTQLQPADAGHLQTAGLKSRRIVPVVAADFRDKRTYKPKAIICGQGIKAASMVHRTAGKNDDKVTKRPTLAKSSRQMPGFTNRFHSATSEADGCTHDPPTAFCNCHHGTKQAASVYHPSGEARNVSLSEALVEDATRRSRCHGYRRELRDMATQLSLTDYTSPFVWCGTESENAFLAAKQSPEEDSPRVSTVRGACTWFHIAFMGLVLLSASLLTFCVFYAVGNMTLNANDLTVKRTASDDANIVTVVAEDDAAALPRNIHGNAAFPDSRLRLTAAIRRSKLRHQTTPSDSGTPND